VAHSHLSARVHRPTFSKLTARKLRHHWQVQQYVLLSWCQQKTLSLCPLHFGHCCQFFKEISFSLLLLLYHCINVQFRCTFTCRSSSRSIYRVSQKKGFLEFFFQKGLEFLVQFYTTNTTIIRFYLRWTAKFYSIICSLDEVMPH